MLPPEIILEDLNELEQIRNRKLQEVVELNAAIERTREEAQRQGIKV